MTVKFITAKEAVKLIPNGAVIGLEGFMGNVVAEEILEEMETAFLEVGAPNALTTIYSAGIGDSGDLGMNRLAYKGMSKMVIGGHWGLAPKLQPLVAANELQAYNFPQGVISQAFRELAAGKNFLISKTGLGTFVDPEQAGGRLNEVTPALVDKIQLDNEDYLMYHFPRPNVAILRGTYADEDGNISMDEESLTLETTSIATAAHNNGGIVIVQVKHVVKSGSLDPKSIKVPGILVDYVVEVADVTKHKQTLASQYKSEFVTAGLVVNDDAAPLKLDQKKIIGRRGAMLVPEETRVVNYGIGVPEYVAAVFKEEGLGDNFTAVLEPGTFGGAPQGGFDFGSAISPEAIIDQNLMFDFYDGGGIDVAYLGLAEVDQFGNVNVSKFGPKIAGTGGFVNISQNTHTVIFTGTLTAGGLKTSINANGELQIDNEGRAKKFVQNVEQITFSAATARHNKQNVYYVTERAVFKLVEDGVQLLEIAPGVDLQKDVLDQMDFKPIVQKDVLNKMDSKIFRDEKMGLQ